MLDASIRHPRWASVPDAQWSDWRWQQRNRVSTLAELEQFVALDPRERDGVGARGFPFAITPYYASLMDCTRAGSSCPIRRQAIPVADEGLPSLGDMEDPLGEDDHRPVEIISHRYPDRALLYVSHNCPVYCRHCTRARKVGDVASAPGRGALDEAYAYLRRTPAIRDVLISGGDPLSLSDRRLVEICQALRAIPSVEVLRLCTRNPVTLPQRITAELLEPLRELHPIWVSTHFNHPRECTAEAGRALERLADAGFAIGNQTVLLRDLNDDAETITALNRWLVRHRCRPYYLFQCDPVRGSGHLRTPIETGLRIIDELRGRLSGLAIPQFVVDLPGGGGKVALTPDRVISREGRRWRFRNAHGREYEYVDPDDAPAATPRRAASLPLVM
ncbi:KamA family radical SAM protein [Enhygromyxa salina]|uniref:L-lysine 2,3-aminomutase n=1 Tax=Enhygromyxa salina TaxID=215803 RepID=A0A2S9YW22_9BACT|nr:KamA family radical SAM protein [Enhygromyxa salina]PRQ09297.1 L-lysine 2,3-aminomutase [Enhygromyxa salina]